MGFFDDLSKKATETYKNTTDKTSKMAREMRLKSYIGENKNKIEKVYTVIGRKVYEKHVEGKIDEIDEYIKPELDEIAQIARKIENMNTEIRAINNLKLCEKCAAEIGLDAKFCPKCGAKQEQGEESINKNAIENVVNSSPVVPGENAEQLQTENQPQQTEQLQTVEPASIAKTTEIVETTETNQTTQQIEENEQVKEVETDCGEQANTEETTEITDENIEENID